ncbi:MAG: GNAT family N-acetyltransferase [Planctomycetes bacterium]|nr:GNAT family N-acetyltransferase [Planctomycetota bacterium]
MTRTLVHARSSAAALRPTTPDLDEVLGSYRLRFQRTAADLEACQRLRFRVFNVELQEGLVESHLTGLDRDRYDAQCDHLMVEDVETGALVGTYRMQTHDRAAAGLGYYSHNEFELASLPASLLDDSVELGRACIEKPHRNRRVLFLLWRGLAVYGRWNQKRWMLGCSSLSTTDAEEGWRAYDWLDREGFVRQDLVVPVREGFRCEPDRYRYFTGEFALPPLFDAYMRHGARICSEPALDAEFGTVDFLTLIDIGDVRARFYASLTAGLADA